MFTTKCFIRKNTPELRKKLEELGYISHIYNNNDANNIYVDKLGTYISVDIENQPYFIDCNENEDLFLALAALRDDTDKYQWFIYNSMDCTVEKLRHFYWFKCEEDKIEDMMYWDCMYLNCTKATVKELIEYFK
jgi:hypothetical protein